MSDNIKQDTPSTHVSFVARNFNCEEDLYADETSSTVQIEFLTDAGGDLEVMAERFRQFLNSLGHNVMAIELERFV